MPIKIALGGDVNISQHRGDISGLVQIKRDPPLVRYWRKSKKLLWASLNLGVPNQYKNIFAEHRFGNYRATQVIENILLEDYGGFIWKNPLEEISEYDDFRTPFKYIGTFFKDADIGHVNLETPLSSIGRHMGMFCSSPDFAEVLKENNINIVSIANNHSFDASESGFIETMGALKKRGIKFVGGGMNIDEARSGEVLDTNGVRVGFLGYTALCNSLFRSLVTKKQPGILPLYEPIILEDIKNLKKKCDFLIVAPHFDIENITKIHKNSIAIAHKMIDNGADLIIGNHAHVPKPIEIYKGKLIIYCLGSLVFMERIKYWGNSLVAQVSLTDSGRYEWVRLYPINTKDINCNAPYIIENKEGDYLLAKIKTKSKKKFDTPMILDKHFLEITAF